METLLYIFLIFTVVIISMTLHEAMHAYASYWLGDDTARLSGRLTFNPIKHIDPFLSIVLPILLAISGAPIFGGAKPVPFNPHNVKYEEWGVAIVAVAGPLTNFLLAFIAFGLRHLLSNIGIVDDILALFVLVNLGFFVFNMIPIPPLDGSRVLYALAPAVVQQYMEVVERYGIFLVFGLVLIAGSMVGEFVSGITSGIISLFTLIFSFI